MAIPEDFRFYYGVLKVWLTDIALWCASLVNLTFTGVSINPYRWSKN
jgi:hypothetical protein